MNAITLDNNPKIIVKLRPNTRARRMTLRRSARDGSFAVSFPKRLAIAEVNQFIQSHQGWLEKHYRPQTLFEIGVDIPFRGRVLTVIEGTMRGARIAGDQLQIKSTNPARAATAFLKSQASLYAVDRLDFYAEQVGRHVNEIRWRDPKTRWGSCDNRGNIMLSWRLIMAPDWVFDYVIAHEVAHLVHMDHSHRFWDLVEKIYPDHLDARDYLKKSGNEIQSYNF